ncbi:MAG: MoaD/ThiS family protein [Desulforhopalus sp.]
MVEIHFRMSEVGRIEITLTGPERLENVLRRCSEKTGIEQGAIIAVRDGAVLGSSDLIADGDCVDIFPAITGG